MTLKNIDGSETPVFALEKLSSGNRVVGYTELKPYSSEKYNILSVENFVTTFNVFQKRSRFNYKTVGYIPVGTDGNEFIAVVKFRYLPCILLILLLLGMLICFNFCGTPTHDNNTQKPWNPVIQDFSDQGEEDNTTKSKSSIDVIGFTAISADKNSGKAKVCLSNPAGNPCYFKFYIRTESGVSLYESDLVPPGKDITKITLNTTTLEKGKYKAYVFIETHELETGEEMNFAKFDIDLILK
ncbi:MAG: hypothetical protein K2G60_06165 [Oscillospiraceae bacterium]|nr:hypothetical protein [Oscillospiraceae bacterium]